jgi:hypothetical protein
MKKILTPNAPTPATPNAVTGTPKPDAETAASRRRRSVGVILSNRQQPLAASQMPLACLNHEYFSGPTNQLANARCNERTRPIRRVEDHLLLLGLFHHLRS